MATAASSIGFAMKKTGVLLVLSQNTERTRFLLQACENSGFGSCDVPISEMTRCEISAKCNTDHRGRTDSRSDRDALKWPLTTHPVDPLHLLCVCVACVRWVCGSCVVRMRFGCGIRA